MFGSIYLGIVVKTANFITVKEFCLRHGVSTMNVYQREFADGVLSREVFPAVIDENYFIRRDAFARRVREEAQENFFELSEFFDGNASAVARLIAALGGKVSSTVYSDFFCNRLFRNKWFSVLSNTISSTMWEFWRISRWLIKIVREVGSHDERVILQYIKDR